MKDSAVVGFLNKMTDLIVLNIIWILCCLPILTIGAATTAMYYVNITSIRQGDGYVVRRFLKSFRQNFKQATLLWLLLVAVCLLAVFDFMFWYRQGSGLGKIMIVLSMAVVIVLFLISLYLFPVLAKFEGTLRETIKNSAVFSVGYLPYTLITAALTLGFLYANYVTLVANAISLFIGFALLSYLKAFFFYKVFMNHMDERFDDFLQDGSGE